MIGIVRRVNLVSALALLLSGLLQPLAAAQGMTCARTHAPAQEAPQAAAETVEGSPILPDGSHAISAPHQHTSFPQPDAIVPSSARCAVAAIASEQRLPSPAVAARQLLSRGDLPAASLFVESLFRPPRLS
jgi:hypothetical protein